MADEIKDRYDPEPTKILEETKETRDTEFAKNINRSYRDVLKDAMAKDKAARMADAANTTQAPADADCREETKYQSIILKQAEKIIKTKFK